MEERLGLNEIILVWNAPRSELVEAAGTNSSSNYPAQIIKWAASEHNPLRIFYAFDHGLSNSLLNRYNPKLMPENEALVYFDDDGPFYTIDQESLLAGLELWKRYP